MHTVLVTGGAGFIGGNFVHLVMAETDWRVVNLDKLTYAGNLDTLASLTDNARHCFVQGDIADPALVVQVDVDAGMPFDSGHRIDGKYLCHGQRLLVTLGGSGFSELLIAACPPVGVSRGHR